MGKTATRKFHLLPEKNAGGDIWWHLRRQNGVCGGLGMSLFWKVSACVSACMHTRSTVT